MQVNLGFFFSFLGTAAVRILFFKLDCCNLENEIRTNPSAFFSFFCVVLCSKFESFYVMHVIVMDDVDQHVTCHTFVRKEWEERRRARREAAEGVV